MSPLRPRASLGVSFRSIPGLPCNCVVSSSCSCRFDSMPQGKRSCSLFPANSAPVSEAYRTRNHLVICGCKAGLYREAFMKFTFHGFSGRMPALLLTSSSQRGTAGGFGSFLQRRTLGITGGSRRLGAQSHCGRPAHYPHAVGPISIARARIGST